MFKGEQVCRVVEFLNPIFYPNKSQRVTARLATAYIETFSKLASPDWVVLLEEVIWPQFHAIQRCDNSKTFLTSYILHLYLHSGYLELEGESLSRHLTALRNRMARIPLSVEEKPLAILLKEASSSRAPVRLTKASPLPRERLSPTPWRKPSFVEKVVFMSKEVSRSIQNMQEEILEARTLHKALRKVFGWKEEEDILFAARETPREMLRLKKEVRAYQEERRKAKRMLEK